jgi:(heptosyl)LPS beta-1,4-glucosyltransferase
MKSKTLVQDNPVPFHEFEASDREAGSESDRTPTLGVVAICYNEEQDLPAFLEHLLPWVNEIVLVDDGSTDRTLEIARNAGPAVSLIVSPRRTGEYYSHQRNKGINAARSDWLLHMDIDERVTPKLREEIQATIRRSDVDACRFHRQNFFLHRPIRGCGWQLWSYLHLARRIKFKFGGKVHEKCLLDSPKERIKRLKGHMWHFNEDTYDKRIKKSIFYTAVRAETIIESGKRVRVWDLVARPLIAFLKTYFLFLGFRDGVIGWILSMRDMAATFDAYVIVWDAQNRIPRENMETRFAALHSPASSDHRSKIYDSLHQ